MADTLQAAEEEIRQLKQNNAELVAAEQELQRAMADLQEQLILSKRTRDDEKLDMPSLSTTILSRGSIRQLPVPRSELHRGPGQCCEDGFI